MALLDLSLVTRCFTTLLGDRLPLYRDWPAATTLLASAGAPDLVGAPYALSFYLYHVREDAHTKSQDWGANDPVPQRLKPMGLTLYYVLSPRSNITDPHQRALADQLMLGLAIKTMHDVPFIDDTTTIDTPGGPELLMPLGMRGLGNRLRATLQPTPVSDAVQYWQAGTNSLRAAAYYEVGATLLQPDEPQSRSGRVLMVNVNTVVRGRPRIEATANTIEFTPPGALDPHRITCTPAQVPYDDLLQVQGHDFKGERTDLLIDHRDFAKPLAVDDPWALATDGHTLSVKVQRAIGTQPLLPGVYGAVVQVTTRVTLRDGTQRDFDAVSNESAFAIAPSILSTSRAGALVTVKVDGFEPHLLAAVDLLVFAGTTRLARASGAVPGPGQFVTPTSAALKTTIQFAFPASAVPGSVLPLRLVVRNAESTPWWESVP